MANRLNLAFSVATANTILTPAQAAAKLAAVPLYSSGQTDPILGQAFGLTVAIDEVSTGGVTYTAESGGPFLPGETVTATSGGTATVALDEDGMLYFVLGTESGTFAHLDTITGGTSLATATVNNAAADGGPTPTTPGATRVLTLNMTSVEDGPTAPPPFPCRPTGPIEPPPGAAPTTPYTLTETTENPYTELPQTLPAPAAVLAFYSTSDLDTDGIATVPPIPPGSGAQVVELSYKDSTGAGFSVFVKLMGKFPAEVTLAGGSVDVAEVIALSVFQTGAFENSVGQITLAALAAPLPTFPTNAAPEDFPGLTDAAQMTITRPLVYLPPSYFALAQQPNSAPQLAGDFGVKQDSPTVLTTVSQVGILTGAGELAGTVNVTHDDASITFSVPQLLPPGTLITFAEQPSATYSLAGEVDGTDGTLTALYTGTSAAATTASVAASVLELDSQPGVEYEVASVYETGLKLTTAYTGLTPAEIAPAAEQPYPARSVSEDVDRVVTSASLVSPSQAAPPDDQHLTTLLSEFTLPQATAPALTYADVFGGQFTPGEIVNGKKSTGSAAVLYDDPGQNESGTLAFAPGSVKIGFLKGETVTGATSHATATVVNPRTLASNPLPTQLSGLYARTLSLVLGAPVVSQPITLV